MLPEQVAAWIPVLSGLSVTLLVIGIFRGNGTNSSAVERRMGELKAPEAVDPLATSFAQRIVRPIIATILRVTTNLLPNRVLTSVNEKIETAGRPTTANRFITLWVILGIGAPAALLVLIASGPGGLSVGGLLFFAGSMLAGLYLPWVWLRRKALDRVRRMSRDLPDAIDLIITNVEAGMGMQAALLAVSEKFPGPIGEEFGRVVRETSIGADRSEALIAMAQRTNVPEMRLFARSTAQAEQTGIPVARVLRNHSAETREKRRQLAREQAAKIPVKITFPTILIMFPTLFLAILGPVAVNAIHQFGLMR
jgi:tight adherence protein C